MGVTILIVERKKLLPNPLIHVPSQTTVIYFIVVTVVLIVLLMCIPLWGKFSKQLLKTTTAVATTGSKIKWKWLIWTVVIVSVVVIFVMWMNNSSDKTKVTTYQKVVAKQDTRDTETPQPDNRKKIWVYPNRWTMIPTDNMVKLCFGTDEDNQCLVRRVIVNPQGLEVLVDPEPYKSGTKQPPKTCDKVYLIAIRSNGRIEDGFPVTYWNQ